MEAPKIPTMAFLTTWTKPILQNRLSRLSLVGSRLSIQVLQHRIYSKTRFLMTSVPEAINASGTRRDFPERSEGNGMFALGSSFSDLGTSPDVVERLARRSIVTPTKVQAAVIPLMLRGLAMQADYAAQICALDKTEEGRSHREEDGSTGMADDVSKEARLEEDAEIREIEKPVLKRPRPHADDSEDVMMIGAETGSGKTLAYLLPYVEASRRAPDVNLKAIILVPSRELCWQVADLLADYFPDAPQHLVLAGGQPPDVSDIKAVRAVIATPVALLNYFRFSEKPDASDKMIVVDEADMLLSGSFLRDVERILDQPGMKPFATRKNGPLRAMNRNRLLFVGATYPHWTGERVKSIITWMRRRYPNLKAIQTEDIHKKSSQVRSRWHLLKTELERIDMLVRVLQEDTVPEDKLMVFASGAASCQRVFETVIARMGAEVIAQKFGAAIQLHKNIASEDRKSNLSSFRAGDARLLFCTDLGARGLDLGDVSLVVEFEFSTNVVGYLHRIGRTARAGASGRTEHFYGEVSRPLAEAIRERAEKETTVVEGVFSRNRSFRRKLKKRSETVTDLEDVLIDEVDDEEEERLRK